MALAAQGFARPRPGGTPTARHLRSVLDRTRLLQIDSITVLERAHYVPVYSRLGGYRRELLDRAAYGPRRSLFEYWGHAASLLPVSLFPLLRWRMDAAEQHAWGGMLRVARDHPGLVDRVHREVADRGPVTARQLEGDRPRNRENWGWNWSEVKHALEWLFRCGRVSIAARPGFERVYDLTERVIPREQLDAPVPDRRDAVRQLVDRSAASLGVATVNDLADYFRLSVADTRRAVIELVEAGALTPVTVDGWSKPAWRHHSARLPRTVAARSLVSPFDPLVWNRERDLNLWNFHYRIEIYVPRPQRRYGYYVLPFLLGDDLVARVDLRALRRDGVLEVAASWSEPHTAHRRDVPVELAAELRELAEWLGLGRIVVAERGDLAAALSSAVAAVN